MSRSKPTAAATEAGLPGLAEATPASPPPAPAEAPAAIVVPSSSTLPAPAPLTLEDLVELPPERQALLLRLAAAVRQRRADRVTTAARLKAEAVDTDQRLARLEADSEQDLARALAGEDVTLAPESAPVASGPTHKRTSKAEIEQLATKIVELLAGGRLHLTVIVERLGAPYQVVSGLCSRLTEEGQLVRPAKGYYELPAPVPAAEGEA